jgi:hypothetical protein
MSERAAGLRQIPSGLPWSSDNQSYEYLAPVLAERGSQLFESLVKGTLDL